MITERNISSLKTSRIEAKCAGESHYQGAPCLHGGAGIRRVSDRHCICEKCSGGKTAKSSERKRKSYLQNVEMRTEQNRIYRKENPHIMSRKRSNRRARERTAVPSWFGEWDDFVLFHAMELRGLRETATGIAWHLDHMVPLQSRTASGLHCAANFQVIPAIMNTLKKNKMQFTAPGEWVRFA